MLETVCEVREVERCEEVLEVVPECRVVERQERRLKEQECSSVVEREQCWLGQGEVSLIKWPQATGKIVSSLIWPDTLFIRMGSVLANMAGHYIT